MLGHLWKDAFGILRIEKKSPYYKLDRAMTPHSFHLPEHLQSSQGPFQKMLGSLLSIPHSPFLVQEGSKVVSA